MGNEEATRLGRGSSLHAETCLACTAWLGPPLCNPSATCPVCRLRLSFMLCACVHVRARTHTRARWVKVRGLWGSQFYPSILGPTEFFISLQTPFPMGAVSGLDLWILLPQNPESWDNRHARCSALLHSRAPSRPPQIASPINPR